MNVGIFGLLTLLLVILKVFGFFAYSWWAVFAPLIISTVVTLFLVVITFLFVIAAAIAAGEK